MVATFDWGATGTGLGALTSIGGGIFSAITGSEDANKVAGIEKQEANVEENQNAIRQRAMNAAFRQQMFSTTRSAQFQRSMAMNAAAGSGSQFSSGLSGVEGNVGGMYATNASTLGNSFQTGKEMFQTTDQLDLLKRQLADAQSKMMTDMGIGKLIGGIGGSMGNLFKFGAGLPGLFPSG